MNTVLKVSYWRFYSLLFNLNVAHAGDKITFLYLHFFARLLITLVQIGLIKYIKYKRINAFFFVRLVNKQTCQTNERWISCLGAGTF